MCVPVCVWCRTLSTLLYHHLPHSPKAGYLAKPEVGSFFLVRLADLQILEISMSPVLRWQGHTALLDFLHQCRDLNLGFHPYATRAASPLAISIFPHAFEKRFCLFVCLLACLTIMIIHLKFPVYLEETWYQGCRTKANLWFAYGETANRNIPPCVIKEQDRCTPAEAFSVETHKPTFESL